MFDAGLFVTTEVSVDQIGVLPWSFITWCLWFLLYTVYKHVFQIILKKMCYNEEEGNRLIGIYWNMCFTAITVPFALANLSLPLDDALLHPYLVIENNVKNWFTRDPLMLLHTKLSFILLTGYYLNYLCQISLQKGFKNTEFLTSEFFTMFFVSSFSLRCTQFGMAVVGVVNVAQASLEFCRLLVCFSVATSSLLLRRVSELALIFHCFLWFCVYIQILPKYFLMTAATAANISQSNSSLVACSVLLNFALWAFYLLEVYQAPATRVAWNLMTGRHWDVKEVTLKRWGERTEGEDEEEEEEDVRTVDDDEAEEDKSSSSVPVSPLTTKKNLRTVYQTVKCYMVVKRKLSRIREKLKQRREAAEEEESDSHEPSITDDKEEEEGSEKDLNEALIA